MNKTDRFKGDKIQKKIYQAWSDMKQRCYNSKTKFYYRYGGRGIKVCSSWLNSFENFLKDLGKPAPKESLDRINNNGHYSCGKCKECLENNWASNCRWTTIEIQNRNKVDNVNITYNNKTQCLRDWSIELDIDFSTLKLRIQNFGEDKAIEMSKDKKNLRYKPNAVNLTLNDETHNLTEWGKILGIPVTTLCHRKKRGWSDEKTLSTPSRKMNYVK